MTSMELWEILSKSAIATSEGCGLQRADAEDVGQAVCLKLWAMSQCGQLNEQHEAMARVRRFARNAAIDRFRRSAARKKYEANAIATKKEASPERGLEIIVARDEVEWLLQNVDDADRDFLQLRLDNVSLTWPEFARCFGFDSHRAACQRWSRLRKKLEMKLSELEQSEDG